MVDIFWELESMKFGLSNAVSDVSLRFLVNFLDLYTLPLEKIPKKGQTEPFGTHPNF